MEVEYSTNKKARFAYTFCDWEKRTIAKALKPLLKKFDLAVEKIKNDPENEGQATFDEEVRIILREKELIDGIIKDFTL